MGKPAPDRVLAFGVSMFTLLSSEPRLADSGINKSVAEALAIARVDVLLAEFFA